MKLLNNEHKYNETDTLLNVDDVCKMLQIKKSTIYKMTMKRELPFIRIGKQLRFKRSQITEYLDQNFVAIGDFNG